MGRGPLAAEKEGGKEGRGREGEKREKERERERERESFKLKNNKPLFFYSKEDQDTLFNLNNSF